jgi:hypothetical protein
VRGSRTGHGCSAARGEKIEKGKVQGECSGGGVGEGKRRPQSRTLYGILHENLQKNTLF